MKKLFIVLIIIMCSASFMAAQKVDGIKAEQSGDFIKIKYQILNSTSDQIYRVQIYCSINGGLNTQLRSVSGDVGDNVVGGKTEYWAVWDVLKDVDEIKSVEFVVNAELENRAFPGKQVNKTGWDKKRVNIMFNGETPGPKLGARLGYLGDWGILARFVKGKSVKATDAVSHISVIGSGEPPSGNEPVVSIFSASVTKRIVNNNGFQMHLSMGLAMGQFKFLDSSGSNYTFSLQNLKGFEVGTVLGIKSFSAAISWSHFDPGQVEKKYNGTLTDWTIRSYIDFGLGVRF